jgi:hypothetical protein
MKSVSDLYGQRTCSTSWCQVRLPKLIISDW